MSRYPQTCRRDVNTLPVYLVGYRARHHAGHSGYEGFAHHVGVLLEPPFPSRWLTDERGWKVDTAISEFIGRRHYSLGMLLSEAVTARHMLEHPKAVYHAIYGDLDLWLLPKITQTLGNPLVATFHEPVHVLEWLGIEECIRSLDAAILLSSCQREFFGRLLSPEKIFVVPHGIDTDFFRPPERASTSNRFIVTVGSNLRDFTTLMEAMEIVWRSAPDLKLVAVGTQWKGEAHAVSASVDSRVQLLEGISDERLLELYHAACIAVLPLQEAVANNALLEAMACGLPTVATDIGGVREYAGEGAAILCAPRDAEAFAIGILCLARDDDIRAAMAETARARAVQYDYRVVAHALRDVYRRVWEAHVQL